MVAVITSTSSCVILKDKNSVTDACITAYIFIHFRALEKDRWNWKTNKLKICYSALVKHLKIFDKHLTNNFTSKWHFRTTSPTNTNSSAGEN